YKADLNNTLRLCEAVGNPQSKFKSIHVAGTNGKGSSSHMLASIFQSAGYKTGLYTSPHLKDFTERIRINGIPVSQHYIIDFVNRMENVLENIKPSFFETTVAMAFEYFVLEKVDIAIIEVGLGGRLDSTNVITPELSLITNIGWDHKDILGDTLEKIAFEKAGIIKENVPVVVSERQTGIDVVFINKAEIENASLYFAADDYHVERYDEDGEALVRISESNSVLFDGLKLPLQGFYQQKNVAGVLKAIDILQTRGWSIPHESVGHGLTNVVSQTKLKGRWQKLSDKPLIICDTGHNENGIKEIIMQIHAQQYDRLFMIIGMVKDKDISSILKLLPQEAEYYFCEAKIPRSLDAAILKDQAASYGLTGIDVKNVNEAITMAKERASANDMIFIGGSTFVVAEIENL
ncbi:MAG TPA: folylpolyglutamate synthase/dihydrofolate synthase family protein, partial [Chryseolinea sp.]|nr:folylpolyglutamate synthase/dihydrofolate synthase family protein [Chryseolinea sp.]